MMLHNNYKGVRPCGFRQEDFYVFCKKTLKKHALPRAGPFFFIKVHNLNKLSKVALGDATN